MIIKSRAEWNARPPRYTNPLNFDIVNQFIVHYSGASRSQTVRSIQNYSMDVKGYSDIDYNYIVKDGVVFMGRGDNKGGHTLNNNSFSIGVCVIGRDGDATDADFAAVRELYDHMCVRIGKQLAKLGHQDANPGQTDCPGPQIEAWVKAGMPAPGGTEDEDDSMRCKYGDKDSTNVMTLQVYLRYKGYDISADGEYGDQTKDAVAKHFPVGDGSEVGPWQAGWLLAQQGAKGDKGDPGDLTGKELIMTAKITHG